MRGREPASKAGARGTNEWAYDNRHNVRRRSLANRHRGRPQFMGFNRADYVMPDYRMTVRFVFYKVSGTASLPGSKQRWINFRIG